MYHVDLCPVDLQSDMRCTLRKWCCNVRKSSEQIQKEPQWCSIIKRQNCHLIPIFMLKFTPESGILNTYLTITYHWIIERGSWDGILGHKFNKWFGSFAHATHSPFYLRIFKEHHTLLWFSKTVQKNQRNKKSWVYS